MGGPSCSLRTVSPAATSVHTVNNINIQTANNIDPLHGSIQKRFFCFCQLHILFIYCLKFTLFMFTGMEESKKEAAGGEICVPCIGFTDSKEVPILFNCFI